MCSSSPPDYSAQMSQQAVLSAESAKADLDFRKQQYADAKPRLEQLYTTAQKVADAQSASMNESNARAAEQNKFYKDNYQPTELRSLQEANAAGTEDDQNAAAGRAVADVTQQQDIARGTTNRGLQSMGVNPNSGRFVGAQNTLGLNAATTSAGAATSARTTAKNTGIALRAGAVATGRGLQNIAGQTANTSINQGNSSVNNSNTGAQGGLGYAGLVGAGYQNQTAAATGLFNGYANLQGQSNQINSQSGSGFGQLLGTLGGAAITSYSDINLKENIKYVGENKGFDIYEFNYAPNANLPEGKFEGVLAQDIEHSHPEAINYDAIGYMKVNYKTLGIEMRAV